MPVKGLLAKKIGTTEFFREDGEAVCVEAPAANAPPPHGAQEWGIESTGSIDW